MATETTSKLFNKMSRLRSIIGDYILNLIKIVSAIHSCLGHGTGY